MGGGVGVGWSFGMWVWRKIEGINWFNKVNNEQKKINHIWIQFRRERETGWNIYKRQRKVNKCTWEQSRGGKKNFKKPKK